jgi:hypothetical protein
MGGEHEESDDSTELRNTLILLLLTRKSGCVDERGRIIFFLNSKKKEMSRISFL